MKNIGLQAEIDGDMVGHVSDQGFGISTDGFKAFKLFDERINVPGLDINILQHGRFQLFHLVDIILKTAVTKWTL